MIFGKLLFASRETKMCVLIPESVSALQSDLSGLLHAYFEFLKAGHLNFVVVREITASISSHISVVESMKYFKTLCTAP